LLINGSKVTAIITVSLQLHVHVTGIGLDLVYRGIGLTVM